MTEPTERNPEGRPPKFKSVEDLQAKIDAYFEGAYDAQGKPQKPLSITGLALALDTTRETLMDYQNKDEFSYTVKKAKLRIERYYEESLLRYQASGAIFALKNFGWKDQQHVRITDVPYTDESDKSILNDYASPAD